MNSQTFVGAVWRLSGLGYWLGSSGGDAQAPRSSLGLLAFLLIARAALLALAFVAFAWALVSPAAPVSHAMFGNGATTALPQTAPVKSGWGVKREPMKTFENVGANQTSQVKIPRLERTVMQLYVERGGTTFTAAQITRYELFHGEKSIWGPVSASDLNRVDRYTQGENAQQDQSAQWDVIDFTFANVIEVGGEMIGGLDLTALPPGDIRMEIDIAGATAPTLRGEWVTRPASGGGVYAGLMQRLVARTYPAQAAGDFFPSIDLRGAIAARHFFRGTVLPAGVITAHTAANAGVANSGTGTFVAGGGVVTTLGVPVGRYRALCIEPAANAGTFALYAPEHLGGKLLGSFTVAVAATIPAGLGTLTFTLADAADFVAGDGFFIDVLPYNTDGNVNLIEVKKNEELLWFARSRVARLQQRRYGHVPMAGLEVVDWMLDNHIDALLATGDAKSLDFRLNLTAQDTITVVHQTLINAQRLLSAA